MNFKNLAENLIITIAAGMLGAFIGYKASTNANKQVISQLKPTIEKAIYKETIKNEIKNEIQIDKIKKSDSIKIILDPKNNQKPTNVINSNMDINCIPIDLLSNREKRKLKKSGHIK